MITTRLEVERKILMSSVFVPMTLLVVPPGQPTVERHGPLFPALETNITLCFCTASVITSHILLKDKLTKISDSVPQKKQTHTITPYGAPLTPNWASEWLLHSYS